MKKTIVRRETSEGNFPAELPLILQKIYAARGIRSMDELERGLTHLLPHQDLLGIREATACLEKALRLQYKIIVVGDFDTDGATSSALAVSALRTFGYQHVTYLVPNRFEYGYGLTPEIVDVAAQQQPQLIITVDNGISSIEGVALAKKLGIKVLITDHHLAGASLPDADAIVNPNQPADTFASKNLAGVGVVFYVMLALRTHLREINWFAESGVPEPQMAQFLDLVALGTVADVVPLDKNNRILVHQGLQRMRAGKCRPGILALLEIAGRNIKNLIAADLGFAVAPRLNAAGRLDDMSLGIECLLSEDMHRARLIAKQLDELNKERRVIEEGMQQQAREALTKLSLGNQEKLPLGFCLFNESWHQGVIGILASRVKDRLHRPVIVFAPANENEIKGSARSIPGLHIRDALEAVATQYPTLISKFGGHAMAAGLTLARENYAAFAEAFDREVRTHLNQKNLHAEIYSDGELPEDDFNLRLAETLREAGPWGQNFPEPLFDGQFKLIQQQLLSGKHLKMILETPNGQRMLDAIAFNVDTDVWPNHRLESVRIAYRLDVNEFRGQRSVQLLIEQLEPA